MYKLTIALKRYAVRRLGVKRTASSEDVRQAVGRALKSGKLSLDRLTALTRSAARKELAGVGADRSESESASVSRSASVSASASESASKSASGVHRRSVADMKRRLVRTERRLARESDRKVKTFLKRAERKLEKRFTDRADPASVFGRADDYARRGTRARVKSAAEQYERTTKAALYPKETQKGGRHPLAGRPAELAGRVLSMPSELDKAVSGAFFKFALAAGCPKEHLPRWAKMTDHEKDLMQYALHAMPWTGMIGGEENGKAVNRRKLDEVEVKGLLDDTSSGGLYAAPIVFDDAVILTPVLFGELFPYVNLINITRGRRVEGFSMSNPTFTSGVAEGTAITPFDTTAFIAAFDTTVYNAVAAMEIGMDFEEDAPNDIGGIVTQKYGEKALEWLDRVVAVGDGTTEPQGFFNASGTTTVNSDNGTGGGPTVSDYEALMFGVSKQFRKEPGAKCLFVANETTYRRARAIPVGPGDERRVFGMTHADYRLLDSDYAINSNIANEKAAFINLKRYRMYRRLGLTIRVETAGNYLSLRNLRLIVLRMRYGGQLELGGAAAVCQDMQS
jgi:HK97 family phage major capsid protein